LAGGGGKALGAGTAGRASVAGSGGNAGSGGAGETGVAGKAPSAPVAGSGGNAGTGACGGSTRGANDSAISCAPSSVRTRTLAVSPSRVMTRGDATVFSGSPRRKVVSICRRLPAT